MRARHFLWRYSFAWIYLVVFIITQLVYWRLDPASQSSFTTWASTSVVNLKTDPVGCLVVSAFVTGGTSWAWLVLLPVASSTDSRTSTCRPSAT